MGKKNCDLNHLIELGFESEQKRFKARTSSEQNRDTLKVELWSCGDIFSVKFYATFSFLVGFPKEWFGFLCRFVIKINHRNLIHTFTLAHTQIHITFLAYQLHFDGVECLIISVQMAFIQFHFARENKKMLCTCAYLFIWFDRYKCVVI